MNSINPQDLYDRIQKNDDAVIIDVRNSDEFDKLHIDGALLHPLPELDPTQVVEFLKQEGLDNKDIFVTCAGGTRAHKGCSRFVEANIPNVSVIEGGTQAWHEAGLPVGGTSVL